MSTPARVGVALDRPATPRLSMRDVCPASTQAGRLGVVFGTTAETPPPSSRELRNALAPGSPSFFAGTAIEAKLRGESSARAAE